MVIASISSSQPLDALSAGLGDADRHTLLQAFDYAAELYGERLLGTGEGARAHALGMALGIAELRLDVEARVAALLFAVPTFEKDAHKVLETRFGNTVAALVSDISRLNELRVVTRASIEDRDSASRASQIEILRKMLLAMVDDLRVVLLRLASRTQSLRYLAQAGGSIIERRHAIAQETLDLYAPLANRLGIWQLKWELEDLSFRFLDPEVYKRIAGMLDARRAEREAFISRAVEELQRELGAAGMKAEITGRPKHIYSIWNKMRTKRLDFSELRDVHGLRVLVGEESECYSVLAVVHALWQPILNEFDDYIARPKENLYRSLHTAVIGPGGRPLEVQIRTHEMHRFAELGVAAHWRYKEQRSRDPFDEKIAMLRRMLAWRDDIVDASDWVEHTKRAALDDTIYVLTPQNRVIDLPGGSTPIDFAYAVHTGLGHKCRGAKVNGAMVPLDHKLANGDRVEIIAARGGQASGPSRDWMNPALGYIASSRARNKVRQWFNALAMEQTLASGRALVERELQREGRTGANLTELAEALGFSKPEDLFAAAGRDEVGQRALQLAIRGEARGEAGEEPRLEPALPPETTRAPASAPGGIRIVGVDRLLTQLAGCCKPVPPDPIEGFVTRGRGISIHRQGCPSLAHLAERHPERLVEASWGDTPGGSFPVDLVVRAAERIGLLRDVTDVLAREHVRVSALQSTVRQGSMVLFLTVAVASLEQLQRNLPLIRAVPGVVSAARRQSTPQSMPAWKRN